ncbi:hypothetical protein ACQPUY_07595 [Clostridium nigeriense]|uniref:hypothetical protein n=1 Tax=Clostridium nigeriense TaxID=1805470 RepID=UPI003D353A7C
MISIISFIESIFLISTIIWGVTKNIDKGIVGLIIYGCFKILENIIWRCPKCKSKLPKGKSTDNIKQCSYCNYNLD